MTEPKTVAFANEEIQRGFTQFPNAILRDPSLSVGARLTYALLQSYAWESEECFPGQERLATLHGVSERSLRDYLGELQARFLVTRTRRGMGRTNLYRLHTAEEAAARTADFAGHDRKPASDKDRNCASDHDRKPASDKEDSGGKKTQGQEDTDDARVRVDRKPVHPFEESLAAEIVAIFNEVAGTPYTVEANLEMLVRRIREEPDLSGADHRRIIEANFLRPWWAGVPGMSVIYASRQKFEQAIANSLPNGGGAASPSIYDQKTEVAKV